MKLEFFIPFFKDKIIGFYLNLQILKHPFLLKLRRSVFRVPCSTFVLKGLLIRNFDLFCKGGHDLSCWLIKCKTRNDTGKM
jgi:hypothetical protein